MFVSSRLWALVTISSWSLSNELLQIRGWPTRDGRHLAQDIGHPQISKKFMATNLTWPWAWPSQAKIKKKQTSFKVDGAKTITLSIECVKYHQIHKVLDVLVLSQGRPSQVGHLQLQRCLFDGDQLKKVIVDQEHNETNIVIC
jgi:hypothetical protein